jgi:hypothetical protein
VFGASFGIEDVVLVFIILFTVIVLSAFTTFLGIVAAFKWMRRKGPITLDDLEEDESLDDMLRRRARVVEQEHLKRLRAGARADLAEPDPYVDGR